jgi:hypothetical protein
MMEDVGIPVDYNPDATIVHAINSQLLEVLFGEHGQLSGLLIDRKAWIINVLYTHGTLDVAPVLKTSATQHRGQLYHHESERGDVHSFDETVPLGTSVSGRCVLSGRPIWLGELELKEHHQGFGGKYYRRFTLVDVNTGYSARVPKAEIVFPIADHNLNSTTVMGVLNLELFGDILDSSGDVRSFDRLMGILPRESINEFLADFLHVHSSFLQVAVDILDSQPSRTMSGEEDVSDAKKRMRASIEAIVVLYLNAVGLFLDRNSKVVDQIKKALQDWRNS